MTGPGWYDEAMAASYDDDTADEADLGALEPQLDLLEALAEGGPVLELAIGTGRVAIPLSARRLRVEGIEISPHMVARMRGKAAGDEARIPVVIGDMTTATAPGAGGFRLVYLVFNTIMNLLTQDAQIDCFRNAAAQLAPGGRFLVEVMVPELRRLPPGERYVVFDHDQRHVGIDEYDPVGQRLVSHHTTVREGGRVERSSARFRYAWPSELDLMARLAGMELEHRWEDWQRRPFTSDSRRHVSVWRRSSAGNDAGDA